LLFNFLHVQIVEATAGHWSELASCDGWQNKALQLSMKTYKTDFSTGKEDRNSLKIPCQINPHNV
jgi:hypothetical protein